MSERLCPDGQHSCEWCDAWWNDTPNPDVERLVEAARNVTRDMDCRCDSNPHATICALSGLAAALEPFEVQP